MGTHRRRRSIPHETARRRPTSTRTKHPTQTNPQTPARWNRVRDRTPKGQDDAPHLGSGLVRSRRARPEGTRTNSTTPSGDNHTHNHSGTPTHSGHCPSTTRQDNQHTNTHRQPPQPHQHTTDPHAYSSKGLVRYWPILTRKRVPGVGAPTRSGTFLPRQSHCCLGKPQRVRDSRSAL